MTLCVYFILDFQEDICTKDVKETKKSDAFDSRPLVLFQGVVTHILLEVQNDICTDFVYPMGRILFRGTIAHSNIDFHERNNYALLITQPYLKVWCKDFEVQF